MIDHQKFGMILENDVLQTWSYQKKNEKCAPENEKKKSDYMIFVQHILKSQ